MRYLFVHQNFPGQFLHFVRHLSAQGEHEIVFISEANQGDIPGVRRVIYRTEREPAEVTHPYLHEFERGLLRAEAVARSARTLKSLGYVPDIIIGHHGWGELLNLVDVFPETPILGYLEFFYHSDRNDVGFDPEFPSSGDLPSLVRIKNSINLQALNLPNSVGQTPTVFQKQTYPTWAQSQLALLHEGVNLDACKRDGRLRNRNLTIANVTIGAKEPMVTYVARNLEPYRGFHIFMRALPQIQAECPDARIILIGGDGVSYGNPPARHTNWREYMLAELSGQINLDKVHFVGHLPHDDFRTLIKRSDAHVYLTYPFVASWSLREAMAASCPIVASDTAPVREFIEDGVTGCLVPFLEPQRVSGAVVDLLQDRSAARRLGAAARRFAEEELSMERYIARYDELVRQILAGKRSF
ncbi:glycosyltransferase [Neokomagataea thailandica]|uniref:glycosyltransferase n=1 Tax=Neokomagataea TaxID=1223423 RepID=UPI000833A415|nr:MULTISPECIES: glycosyltransferase [Neokomagataea]